MLSLHPGRQGPRHQQWEPPLSLLRGCSAASVSNLQALQVVQMATQSQRDFSLIAQFPFRNSSYHPEISDRSTETSKKTPVGPYHLCKPEKVALYSHGDLFTQEPHHMQGRVVSAAAGPLGSQGYFMEACGRGVRASAFQNKQDLLKPQQGQREGQVLRYFYVRTLWVVQYQPCESSSMKRLAPLVP